MKEEAVKKALKAYLKSIGAFYYMPVPTGYGGASVDFFICHQGRFFAIETKRPGVEEATTRQKCVLRAVAAAGGGWWVENDLELKLTKERIRP